MNWGSIRETWPRRPCATQTVPKPTARPVGVRLSSVMLRRTLRAAGSTLVTVQVVGGCRPRWTRRRTRSDRVVSRRGWSTRRDSINGIDNRNGVAAERQPGLRGVAAGGRTSRLPRRRARPARPPPRRGQPDGARTASPPGQSRVARRGSERWELGRQPVCCGLVKAYGAVGVRRELLLPEIAEKEVQVLLLVLERASASPARPGSGHHGRRRRSGRPDARRAPCSGHPSRPPGPCARPSGPGGHTASGHGCASSASWPSTAARSASRALENATKKESPCVSTSCPPCATNASRNNSWWSAQHLPVAIPQLLDEPRRALDVREEEGDRAARKIRHRPRA